MVFEHDYLSFPELTNKQISDFGFSSPHVQLTEDFSAEVVKVIDADTLSLHTQSRDFDFPLRFLGIDAPELSEGGHPARDWLHNRIHGQRVEIKIDKGNRVGKYGRLLGKVFFQGLDLGQEMLHLGLVSEFGKKDEGGLPEIELVFDLNKWL